MKNKSDIHAERQKGEDILRQACELAIDHIGTQEERPVRESASLVSMRETFGGPLPETPPSAEETLTWLAAQADPGALATTGPRFFGFVIGGTHPVALAADWLASSWDQNSGLYACAPAVSVMEEVAEKWLLELLDLPRTASVGFVTGGQMANSTALAAARNCVLERSGWDVETKGLQGAPTVRLVIPAEAHATIYTAFRLLGLGSETPEHVPCDDQGRMIPGKLEEILSQWSGPTIVCAQAGNVNSGAFEPLAEIVEIAHRHGAWVHIDGAFGLWAAVSPKYSHLLAGYREADSWAVDGHKWLNVPYDCGIAIVADADAHRRSMSVDASYLKKAGGAARDPLDWVPDFSRRARGVPVYAVLRTLGREGVREIIERCCQCAAHMADRLGAHPNIEVLNEVVLNQAMFRFSAAGQDSDELTARVMARVVEEGTCWVGGTRWQEQTAMRFSVSNWSTTLEDIDRSADAILAAVDELT